MLKIFKNAVLTSITSILVACGGGGGSSGSLSGGNSAPSTNSIINNGDYFTYTYNAITAAGTQTAYTFNRHMSSVKSDQSFITDATYSNGTVKNTYETNSDFQEISYISGATSCANSPAVNSASSVKKLTVGTSWDLNYNRTCITSNTSASYILKNKGSAVSSEQYVIAGVGTFDTYKLIYTIDQTSIGNRLIANYTCWRDKNLDRTIACDWSYANYANGSTTTTLANSGTASEKLYAFNVASFTNNKPSVARFAGNWTLSWSGDNTGTCSIVANIVGSITGTCVQNTPNGTSVISGNVDINGNLNISSSLGTSISGSLNSPVSGSGTWKNLPASGTWAATHI